MIIFIQIVNLLYNLPRLLLIQVALYKPYQLLLPYQLPTLHLQALHLLTLYLPPTAYLPQQRLQYQLVHTPLTIKVTTISSQLNHVLLIATILTFLLILVNLVTLHLFIHFLNNLPIFVLRYQIIAQSALSTLNYHLFVSLFIILKIQVYIVVIYLTITLFYILLFLLLTTLHPLLHLLKLLNCISN